MVETAAKVTLRQYLGTILASKVSRGTERKEELNLSNSIADLDRAQDTATSSSGSQHS